MAEASNGVSGEEVVETQTIEQPPNGAAGPFSESKISNESSVFLDIIGSPRTSEPSSPRATIKATQPLQRRGSLKSKVTGSGYGKPSSVSSAKTASTQAQGRTGARGRGRQQEEPKDKCDMCEQMKAMSARCLDCASNMCESCVEHHRKMKISSTHDLLEWSKYISQNRAPLEPPPPPPSKQFCPTHKNEKLQFYCKACLKPLCTNCKLTKHEGHKTRDLWEEIQEQRQTLPMKLSQIRGSFLPLLKQQLKDVDVYEKELTYNVKGTLDNIEMRSQMLKAEVDRTSNKMVTTLKQKEKKETTRMNDRKKALNTYLREATTALTTGERIIQSGDDFEVMEMYQKLIEMLGQINDLIKRKPGKRQFAFQDGQKNAAGLDSIFGGYTEKGSPERPTRAMKPRRAAAVALQMSPEIHPRLLNSFTCKNIPGNKVSAIAPINETEAWVCFGWTTNEIYLYNKDGNRKSRVVLKSPVDDIAADRDDHLVVSTFTGNVVMQIDRRLNVREFFQAPLRIRGVTVSHSGEVIACGVDRCTTTPPPSKCTVFKFSARGNKTGHLDGDRGKNIPVHPYRVAENIDGSIAITDWLNDKEGRVVIFSHDGKIRMVYDGQNPERRGFLPYGIATDRYGHILVGDIINREVHLLDAKGHFLRMLLTSDDLLGERPYSLAVDHMDTLWVGNERAQIKIFRYILNTSHLVGPHGFVSPSRWKDENRSPVARRRSFRDLPQHWEWRY